MLSVPTLWVVFVLNFLAPGLVWAYVTGSYPKFRAARFWTAAAFTAAAGAAMSLLRGQVDPLIPILVGGALLVFSCWLAAMGIQRFYGRPVFWRLALGVTALTVVGLAVFSIWRNVMELRIVIYSLGQSMPLLLTLKLVLSRHEGRAKPGARMAGYIAGLFVAVHVVRSIAGLVGVGGSVSLIDFNAFQAVMVVLLVFLSMMWNFGFLLMAIDQLRTEVADLALLDDLTGVAHRRRLLQRLSEECALTQRTGEPFTLLAIDLDGFKAINDRHGHAAGDECLRLFTRAAQSRLRAGDLLARAGGDEFCIVLRATTQREGAMIARHVLDACRAQPSQYDDVSITVSIGVAQWRPAVGSDVLRLIAAADQALYAAKSEGKNRYAVHNPAPHGALDAEPAPLRQSA